MIWTAQIKYTDRCNNISLKWECGIVSIDLLMPWKYFACILINGCLITSPIEYLSDVVLQDTNTKWKK